MSELGENNLSKSHAERCPKCGGEMKFGNVQSYGNVRILKKGDTRGDAVYAFYCRDCGFIELYKEPSTKEPWRWQKERQVPLAKEPQQPEKEQPSPETKKRLVR